ncbi:MAG: fimbria/pilus outer membrane usher protein [Candidatus Dasytiphilus stammeri]
MDRSVIFSRFLLILLLLSTKNTFSKHLDIVITSPSTLYLEVILNGIPTKKILPIYYDHNHYYMRLEQLKSLGILIPLSEKIQNPVAIDSLKNIFTYYDSAMQRFLINVPPHWLPRQYIIMSKLHQVLPAKSSFGLVFNYDLYCNFPNNIYNHHSQCSNWTEVRFFNKFGVFSNTGTWNHGINDNYHYIRYNTQLHFSDQRHMLLYILGDFDSDKLSWSNTIRLGGIKISRHFSMCPDLITYPLPHFYGHAVLPSTLDLYINNNHSSMKINPGPFTIESLPDLPGAGKAIIVLKDALGNKQSKMMPFYITNEQLKRGLTDFSISLGFLRKNYGINSTNYGDLATSSFLRYGLNPWLTLEGKIEGTPHILNSGLGASIKIFTLGLMKISWSGSSIIKNNNLIISNRNMTSMKLNSYQGQQILIGYTYNNMSFNITAQNIFRSAEYSDLSNYQTNKSLSYHNSQMIGSFALGKYGTLSLGWFNNGNNWINKTQLMNLSYSTTLWQTMNLWTSINRIIGNQGGYNAQLILTLPLSVWGNASYSYIWDINHHIRTNFSRTVPTSSGIGWNLAYENDDFHHHSHQAEIFIKNQSFDIGAGMYGDHYDESYWAEMNGSLVAMAGHIYTTNSIPDAFALVYSNGYPNIPVRYENQFIGRTNKYGYLLVPSVTSWYQSQIEIDPINLPMDVKIPTIIHNFSIRELSGDQINFDIHRLNATSFRVIDKHGKNLPMGSMVKLEGSSIVTWLGGNGELWLEDIKHHNILNITRADTRSTCKVILNITQYHGISTLGPQICQ